MIAQAGPSIRSKMMLTALGLTFVFLVIRPYLTAHMCVATAAYFLMIFAYGLRKVDMRLHGMAMTLAILTDLTLVLTLQFQRDAIQTAVAMTLSWPQQLHVLTSTLATILYLPALVLGLIMASQPHLRERLTGRHRRVALAAFIFRSLGFALMFTMLGRHGLN